MPAKTRTVHHRAPSRSSREPAPPTQPHEILPPPPTPPVEPVIPPPSPDPSLFPPLADQSASSPAPALRLSPEVDPAPPPLALELPPSSPVAQLASLSTNPPPSSPPSAPSSPAAPSSSSPRKILWVFVIVGLVAGIGIAGFAVYHLVKGSKTPGTLSVVVPQPTATPSPSPTPTPALNRSDLKIEVLNGSGIPGLAGQAKDYLEGLGYKDVATGNADSYTSTQTQLSLKSDKFAYTGLILTDLKTNYSVLDQVASLSADNSYDAVITVGQK